MLVSILRALRSRGSLPLAPLAAVALAACQDVNTPSAPAVDAQLSPGCPGLCQVAPAKILFARYVDHRSMIARVNPDGTGLTFLGQGGQPTWSPDFKKIAFTATASGGGIFTMNADGTGRTQVTFGPSDTDPSWSKDGTKIAFARKGSLG